MNEGDIVIVAMLQADGTTKNCPVIILREMPPFQDMLVCGISTQLHQEVKDFDETIAPTDDDFVESSLREKSLIRLGFLTVVPQSPSPAVEEVALSEPRRLDGVEFEGFVVIAPKNFSFKYFDFDNPTKGWSRWQEGPVLIAPDLSDSISQLGAKYAGNKPLEPKTPFRASIFKVKNKDWQEPRSEGLGKPDCSTIPK